MHWKVDVGHSGIKLVAFLKQMLKERFSTRQLKQAIEANLCRLNGVVERFASTKVKVGDRVDLSDDAYASKKKKRFEIEPDRILLEDEALLIYNKPSGMVSGELFPDYPLVNRLDREATGILVHAKTEKALQWMINQYKNREVEKVYMSLVDGVPHLPKGTITNRLGPLVRYQGQTIWGAVKKGGREAITKWKCLKTGPEASLIQCEPVTGKTHQLRVHLKEMGHPVLGDYQYGRKCIQCRYPAKRCLLHGYRLTFNHPTTKKRTRMEAPYPEDFSKAMEALLR